MVERHTAENDALPFACCDHCDCRAERIGHDDTCRICQEPDGTPRVTSPDERHSFTDVRCDHPGLDHDVQWSYCWPCPKCGVCKFIGHGPLCQECYTARPTARRHRCLTPRMTHSASGLRP